MICFWARPWKSLAVIASSSGSSSSFAMAERWAKPLAGSSRLC
jgi:hypothetical protein